jgi:hypothetical protein
MAQLANSASPEDVLELLERESGRGSTTSASRHAWPAWPRNCTRLRRSEQRFRAFFERSTVGMATTDWSKRWIDVNDALCTMLGYTRAEMQARTWAESDASGRPGRLRGAHWISCVQGRINECDVAKALPAQGWPCGPRTGCRALAWQSAPTERDSEPNDPDCTAHPGHQRRHGAHAALTVRCGEKRIPRLDPAQRTRMRDRSSRSTGNLRR